MWKDIKGYEGLYQVSDEGEVRRVLADGSTRPLKGRKGLYPSVSLSKHSVLKSFNIHRLVAEHFLERPVGATEVNHIDGDKWNNNVSNLEWVSQTDNLRHAAAVLEKFPFGKKPRAVLCLDKDTREVIAEFPSVSDAAKVMGKYTRRSAITLCCQGLQETSCGYRWAYKD